MLRNNAFVPATEKRAVKRMVRDIFFVRTNIPTGQAGHKLRNPLAFGHGALNLIAAQIMSKPALISFSESHPHPPPLPREGEATLRRAIPSRKK